MKESEQKKMMLRQMDKAIDLVDRYHAATNKRCYVTVKLTSIIVGNDESQWLEEFEAEVIEKEREHKERFT